MVSEDRKMRMRDQIRRSIHIAKSFQDVIDIISTEQSHVWTAFAGHDTGLNASKQGMCPVYPEPENPHVMHGYRTMTSIAMQLFCDAIDPMFKIRHPELFPPLT